MGGVGALTVAAAVMVYAVPGGNIITGLNDAAFKLRLLLVNLVPMLRTWLLAILGIVLFISVLVFVRGVWRAITDKL